jgi:hypothetical protein
MNGNDIVSVLKHNHMVHSDSYGLVLGTPGDGKDTLDLLFSLGLKVTGKRDLKITTWDYIIIPRDFLNPRVFLQTLTSLNSGGIIVLDVTGEDESFEKRYSNPNRSFSATKVRYEERSYIVIHLGEDYGD